MNRATMLGGLLVAAIVTCGGNTTPRAAAAEGVFGISQFTFAATDRAGNPYVTAGGHPYELTSHIVFASHEDEVTHEQIPIDDAKSLFVHAPPGLIGNPAATPRCPLGVFDLVRTACPGATQVGTFEVTLASFGSSNAVEGGVYNLEAGPGQPAELGIRTPFGISYFLSANLDAAANYAVRVGEDAIPAAGLRDLKVKLWGVPADPRHNEARGRVCFEALEFCFYTNYREFEYPAERLPSTPESSLWPESSNEAPQVAFLTMPTRCSGEPLVATVDASSWAHPAADVSRDAASPGVAECADMAFKPKIQVKPDTREADSATGVSAKVAISDEGLLAATMRAQSGLRDTSVAMPTGIALNPARAAGLAACADVGARVGTNEPPACPLASKIGTARITTPLLEGDPEKELEGSVYLLASEPPNLRVLVTAEADGVDIKLTGEISADERTGQLTARFDDTPDLPFTQALLLFPRSPRAPLVTPAQCAIYTSAATLTPWSAPFIASINASDQFTIDAASGGGACDATSLYKPELVAGSASDQAADFTEFALSLTRHDGEDSVSRLAVTMPPGLVGIIKGVPLCGEPAAGRGECPSGSQIGHVSVDAGAGANLLTVPQAGQPPAPIYLTGPYGGAPYGLSVVVPVIAGPFNLGTVVVRARITVDTRTAQLTVLSDPLPQILKGVPAALRAIRAVIDRPQFMINPTSCKPFAVTGTSTANSGVTAGLANAFRVHSCRSLAFAPRLTATTRASTSKRSGAQLAVHVAVPAASQGSQANIGKVKVDLPKQLPSRLTTLQKACPDATFKANPASCPAGSLVGKATAITPVLRNPLAGPAYLVSHGGAAFPDLIIVLQGEGITLDLVGNTDIKKGVTISTFNSVPDAPISTFDLVLPEGPHSALAAFGNLCKSKLNMPTAITGQNGAVIKRTTRIAVAGCPKHKARRAKTHRDGRRARR
jgi:hypothetical protein